MPKNTSTTIYNKKEDKTFNNCGFAPIKEKIANTYV